jgi:putative ABC transport system substrate-binding protein
MPTLALLTGCDVLSGRTPFPRSEPHVGIVDASAPDDVSANDEIAGLKQGLAELGYVENKTIAFDIRDSEKVDELSGLVNELINLPVDVLVSLSTPATTVSRQATDRVPIVFTGISDPVGIGLVDSIAHPGANLTGVTTLGNVIYGKQLELLHQLVPGAVRVAVLFDSANPAMKSRLENTQTTAHALTLELMPLDVHSTQDIESALASAVAWQSQAVMSFGGPGVLLTPFLDWWISSSPTACRSRSLPSLRWKRAVCSRMARAS